MNTDTSKNETVQSESPLANGPRPIASRVDGVRLAKNTAFNLVGQVLPLLAGVALIPYIIRGLGPDRFGMLGIIWVVFGYFSLMDLGLGRATTKFLAELLVEGNGPKISEIVWGSLVLQLGLGVVGGGIIAALTPLLIDRVLKTPPSIVVETRTAFFIMASAMPVVLALNGLRAVLEGCQRFDITNLLRIPSSTLAFVIPAVAIVAGLHLPGIVLWLAISRLGFAVAHGYHSFRLLPCLKTKPIIRPKTLWPLLSFGGWVTASNVINPILVSMDRFVIGSLLSVALVGFYTAPFEAVTRLWVIPVSLMTTVYPASSALGTARMRDLQALYSRSFKYIFCALGPVSLSLVLFARPIIGAWLGPTYVEKSAIPLQFLAVGVFINSFAHVPYCFLQALGRPDAAAKLMVCELLPYGLLLWWMIGQHGIAGAAAAWSIRVAIEVALLAWIARRVFSLSVVHAVDRRMWIGFAMLLAMGAASYATNVVLRGLLVADVGVCAVWMAGFGIAVWKWVLDRNDRESALGVLAPLRTAFGKSLKGAEAN